LNGEALQEFTSQNEFEADARGWYDAGGNLILAKSGGMSVYELKTFEFQFGG
jgi:alpha-glucosidase